LIQNHFGHSRPVNEVAVTPDNKRAVSGSWDKTVKIWNLSTGVVERTLIGHSLSVNTVSVTSDGRFIISISWDGTRKVWDLETGELLQSQEGYTSTIVRKLFSETPDGKWSVSVSNFNKKVHVVNSATGEKKEIFEDFSSSFSAVTVSVDGKWILSAAYDRTIKIWNMKTGEKVATYDLDYAATCLVTASDGVTIVVGDKAGQVYWLALRTPDH
jgi:WD40 repeat protein